LETVHNPDRYMADLRQLLSQGRKRIGLLIGAGAPLSVRVNAEGSIDPAGLPLIPGVDDLTARVVEALEGPEKIAAEAIRDSLGDAANIETILSRVRLLESALGGTKVHDLDATGYRALGAKICEQIAAIVGVSLPNGRSAYNELVAWIGGAPRPHAIELFTTNYDLLIEEAFEVAKLPYFDGFTGGHQPFFDPVTVAGDDLPARWSRLWKLHGSLGWKVIDGVVVRSGGHECGELVYPDHLKYDLTQKQPYSSLFERLKDFLSAPDTLLLISGFSFRDAHICAVLDEALAMNGSAAAFAFQYQELEGEAAACALALDRPNLSIYASDGAVVNGVSGKWRLGDAPKNWEQIRSSFWGVRGAPEGAPVFLLGDFQRFARFCAVSHSTDVVRQREEVELDDSQPVAKEIASAPNAGVQLL
jgi:hypothetical protein